MTRPEIEIERADERIAVIDELTAVGPRGAGTDAERRAAKLIAARLSEAGRRPVVEPTYVHPNWARTQAAHCVLAIFASVGSLEVPEAGFVLVLVVAASMYGDLNTRWYLLRRLFFRRASQNVRAGGESAGAPAAHRVFLVAHYDAPRRGRWPARAWRRVAAGIPPPLDRFLTPTRIAFWSTALLVPLIGARLAGLDEQLLSNAQLLPTLVLLAALAGFLDVSLSSTGDGGVDNASGVAVALAAAEELAGSGLEEVEVGVLLTGAGGALGHGMREFIRAHRDELDRETTWFVDIDAVGAGPLLFTTAEGLAVTYRHSPHLVELCAAISAADPELHASPRAHTGSTEALAAIARGYPAITLRGGGEPGAPIDRSALERAERFVVTLVGALDRDLAR